MSRVFALAAVALLITVPAWAQDPVQPIAPYEVEVFYTNPDGSPIDGVGHAGEVAQLARCFASNQAEGACNKLRWFIPVTVHASVAQWIDFSLTGTRWDWYVRKPGYYAANCITAKVASNGDVLIDYEGFDDLLNADGRRIPVWYSFGASVTEAFQNGWVPALQLNLDDDLLDESELWGPNGRNRLHEGLTWKLWNRICVDICNTACEYEDVALITLVLNQQKLWIERDPTAPNYGLFPFGFEGYWP